MGDFRKITKHLPDDMLLTYSIDEGNGYRFVYFEPSILYVKKSKFDEPWRMDCAWNYDSDNEFDKVNNDNYRKKGYIETLQIN